MKFENLKDYLDAFEKDPYGLALLPLTEVAQHLGVTRAAVDRRLRLDPTNRNVLTPILINRTRYVATASLLALHQQDDDDLDTLRQTLEKRARAGERQVFYTPVMTPLGLSHRIPADRTRIGRLLGDLSRATYDKDGILLSVLVHAHRPGKTRPGPGFFALVDLLSKEHDDDPDLQYDEDDLDAFVAHHTDKVLRHYKR